MIFGPYLSSVLRLLLPTEYQADLAAAETSLTHNNEPAARLALGKVLLCEGKVKRARVVFTRAEAAADDDGHSALAGGYSRLAELADFGACREWGPGLLPLELARRWSPTAWAIERDQWYQQLPALPAPVEQEVWFVTQIAPVLNELALAAKPDETKPIYGRLGRASERLSRGELSEEIAIGILLVNALVLRLVDERPDALRVAAQGIEFCRAAGHAVGAGLFALLTDDLATTSRTVPEVLDLFANDVRGMSRISLDALEDGPLPGPPDDWSNFVDGKSVARTIFESQGWHIGVGAVQVVSASWFTRAKPADVPASLELQLLVNAKSAFQLATDEAGTQLILCRLLAIAVEQNFPPEEKWLQTAREIGVWGRTTGSLSFALGLGLMLLAVARRWRRLGDLTCALKSVHLAEALFGGLQALVANADAATEEAELLTVGWESSQAIPSWQRALEGYCEAITTMGLPEPGYGEAWQRLRGRVAETGANLLTLYAGHAEFARTRQRLLELNVLPGMTS